MNNIVKIISLGNNQANWVANLYTAIIKKDGSFTYDADNYYSINENQNSKIPFKNTYSLKNEYSHSKYGLNYFFLFLSKNFWKEYRFIKTIGTKKQKKNFISLYFKGYLSNKIFFKKNNYDIYHFHFLKFEYLFQLFFLPQNKKIICSFWGSDLFRSNGIIQYYFQQKALKRANIITVQNEEMAEVVLAKFGRELKPKIKQLLFPLETTLFDTLDSYRFDTDKIIQFKKEILNIPSTHKVVAIGHNANRLNNHLSILQHLNNLSNELKEETVFVFLMTYGEQNKNIYANELLNMCKRNNLQHHFFSEYLSITDLALLKLSTDVFVHLPDSDAMSGSLIEAAYAGNNIITGTWLPYSKFKKSGIQYSTISKYDDLITQLKTELNTPLSSVNVSKNIKGIKAVFHEDAIAPEWIKAYKELLNT